MVLTGGSTANFPEKQLVHGTKGFIFRVSNPKKNLFYLEFQFWEWVLRFFWAFLGFFVILNFLV